ncbi:MAG: hypothetical protein V1745_00550, partial [Patescibacteria group bacterium]
VSSAGDISVIGKGDPADAIAASVLNEDVEGMLVTVEGTIIGKSGSSLDIDTGSETITVSFKRTTGLSAKDYKKEDRVSVSGIVTEDADGYRLLPRYNEDIVPQGGDADVAAFAAAESDPPVEQQPTVSGVSAALDAPASSTGTIVSMVVAGALLAGGWYIYAHRERIGKLVRRLRIKKNPGGDPPGDGGVVET